MQEHINNLSVVRNEVGAAVLPLQGHVKDVILNFQLSFYCKDTSAMKKSSRERLQKMVQSCKELFFLFDLGIKTDRIVKAHKMETYTSQADDLHRQANEVEYPVYIPPYTSCYEALWANYELVQQAREMENAARDIRKQFQEIAASGMSVPSSTSLRKAVVSVKRGKFMFSTDQLAKVVQVLMENFPYILF